MALTNRKVVLKHRPSGAPTLEDFAVIEESVGEPGEGGVLVQVEHLSIDAFILTTLDHDGLHGQVALEAPVTALGVGKVLASNNDAFVEGDHVLGNMGAQQYATPVSNDIQKIDTSVVPARAYLGVLGLTTGLTAHAGMLKLGDPKEGETVVVSGAAGAVGSVACQLAKIRCARVIGIAGGPEKCEFLKEIGCDAAIDYKNGDVNAQLRDLAPDGVNVFFDNVGGSILDAVLDNIATGARVIICGAISQYANMADVKGPSLYLRLAERNSSMHGFTVFHFEEQYPAMAAELGGWAAAGQLTVHEHIEEGIDRFPEALMMLRSGGHRGKLLVAA
jgi:NADPH-dependent curcumin reductase CurA